jgi:fructose-bisphosphate aldolase / 6-deoxy-5-ketofructose 1-phosphate synthase
MQEQPLLTLSERDVRVPANVPKKERARYSQSYLTATKGTDRLMLMAGDQKMEHLNDDFYGDGIHADDANPEHLFQIAAGGEVGVFATQHGLIAQYGKDYPTVPYIVKMNGKSHLVSTDQAEVRSLALVDFQDVLDLRDNGELNIVGIGYTIYVGSENEAEMYAEAGRLIAQAHAHGMIAVVWGYMRGKAVANEKDAHLIAGAAGLATCLGADFVKLNYPEHGAESLQEAVQAAGRTGVIISGGSNKGVEEFLQFTWDTIHTGGCRGSATGRNVHQRSQAEGIALVKALSALIYTNASVEEGMQVYTTALAASNKQ